MIKYKIQSSPSLLYKVLQQPTLVFSTKGLLIQNKRLITASWITIKPNQLQSIKLDLNDTCIRSKANALTSVFLNIIIHLFSLKDQIFSCHLSLSPQNLPCENEVNVRLPSDATSCFLEEGSEVCCLLMTPVIPILLRRMDSHSFAKIFPCFDVYLNH